MATGSLRQAVCFAYPLTRAAYFDYPLTVTERWRRLNYATIEHQVTINDPKIYTAPWVGKTGTTTLVSGAELWETFCVPSDYATFNNQVFLPVAASPQKK